MTTESMHEIRRRLHDANSGLNYSLECFGDALAKREGYKRLDGMEAIHYFLMQRHHWLPSVVRAMSHDDLRFALHQELEGWTLPKAARAPKGK